MDIQICSPSLSLGGSPLFSIASFHPLKTTAASGIDVPLPIGGPIIPASIGQEVTPTKAKQSKSRNGMLRCGFKHDSMPLEPIPVLTTPLGIDRMHDMQNETFEMR